MAKYQCDKGHVFLFPATQHMGSEFTWVESKECPRCQSEAISEFVEPEADIEAVYIHDLTSGDQVILSTLLAEGWKIVNRYAKQYHLEKPKAVESPQEAEDKFTEQARTYYTQLQNHKAEAPLP